MIIESTVYDITMELRDEYTALVNREIGGSMQATLRTKLQQIPEHTGVLLLDFSVVTSIHESFLDEFLVPILRQLTNMDFGDRYIVGIGVNREKVGFDGLNKLLIATGQMFLLYDRHAEPILLGSSDADFTKALKYVGRTPNETADQLAVQMKIPRDRARQLLVTLSGHRIIRTGHSLELGTDFYDPVIDPNDPASPLQVSLGNQIRRRIEEKHALEKNVHYALPSGVHALEFLHLSRIFEDARFASRLALALADSFEDVNVDYVITPRTPNDMVLAQTVADHLDCSVLPARFELSTREFMLNEQTKPRPNATAIIVLDVIGSGWFVNGLFRMAKAHKLIVAGIAAVVNISQADFTVPNVRIRVLAHYPTRTESSDHCPLCHDGVPVTVAPIFPRT